MTSQLPLIPDTDRPPASVIYTDRYPTRYAAFDNPGTLAVFRAVDGMGYLGSARVPIESMLVGQGRGGEMTVYHGGPDDPHLVILGDGRGGYLIDASIGNVGAIRPAGTTLDEALSVAQQFITTGDLDGLPARPSAWAPFAPERKRR